MTKLLHFSTGVLSIAGGVILLIIAISMVLGAQNSESPDRALTGEDPLKLAVFPLAVPYLLNPAGMVVLVTLSAEAQSVGLFIVVIGVLGLVIALDALVFGFANRVSQHLDESRMLVTEKVFGFLLAALAVQLGLNGLADIGVIQLTGH